MASTNENRFVLPAWGLSLTVHGIVVGVAVVCVTQAKPLVPEEAFQWDVALVEATKPESSAEQVPSGVAHQQPPAQVLPPPQPKAVPEMSQVVTPIERKIEPPRPPIETVRPIEQEVEYPEVRQEPIEPSIGEVAEPASEPVAVAASSEPVESQPVQQEPVESAPQPPSEIPVAQEASGPVSEQDGRPDTTPVQAIKAGGPSAEVKRDHRWLADLLWRRVAELKRYPNTARLNGQEGKVIVKAVIRSDGHLTDVVVQKSSGYSALDEAAIEAVKLACPLHMKHTIGKPQIVVSLPIVYSLTN